MKKIFFGLLILLNLSCSLDDSTPNLTAYVEVLPIESVTMPEYFQVGQTYQIDLTYIRPTSCYFFQDIFYDVEGNTSKIAILNSVITTDNCSILDEEVEASFNFTASETGVHVFKFLREDEQAVNTGADGTYMTYEIEVVD